MRGVEKPDNLKPMVLISFLLKHLSDRGGKHNEFRTVMLILNIINLYFHLQGAIFCSVIRISDHNNVIASKMIFLYKLDIREYQRCVCMPSVFEEVNCVLSLLE
jgi:hypothetical protein